LDEKSTFFRNIFGFLKFFSENPLPKKTFFTDFFFPHFPLH